VRVTEITVRAGRCVEVQHLARRVIGLPERSARAATPCPRIPRPGQADRLTLATIKRLGSETVRMTCQSVHIWMKAAEDESVSTLPPHRRLYVAPTQLLNEPLPASRALQKRSQADVIMCQQHEWEHVHLPALNLLHQVFHEVVGVDPW
jgi:hypothetical protein